MCDDLNGYTHGAYQTGKEAAAWYSAVGESYLRNEFRCNNIDMNIFMSGLVGVTRWGSLLALWPTTVVR